MKRIVFFLIVLVFSPSVGAQEPIKFARTPDISPDGKRVAFSYLGDIWIVEAIGGVARPLTTHEAHDYAPFFSPDGRHIAFSSNRHGSYDVFVVPSYGGKPKRLTFDSAQDVVIGWSRDGKNILFTSNRSASYPSNSEVYSVPMEGGRETKLPYLEAKDVNFAPNGAAAFVRGPGTWYRKGYRGSSNDDIWLASADGKIVKRLTDFNAQDSFPNFSPDGKKLYYVSEVGSQFGNVTVQDMDPSQNPPVPVGKPRVLTNHKDDPVRRLRLSGNGEWLVYECGTDIWIANAKDGSTRKLAIEVHADEKSNSERVVTYTRDISEYAISPDENFVAFVVHGEVFVMPLRGGKATRVTDTPAVEHGLSWSKDGKKLLFISDRTGYEDIYSVESDDPAVPELTKTGKFKVTQITKNTDTEFGANFTPDGSRILFIRGGKLVSIKNDGTDEKILVKEPRVFDYDWSPDGKYIVYARSDGSFASELYIIPSDGSKEPVNITRYATFNGDVSWNNPNGKIAFLSERRGSTTMHVLSLQKPTPTSGIGGGTFSGEIDWEDIHLRVNRPSPINAREGTISKNGRFIAFRDTIGAGDLWVADSDGTSALKITSNGTGPRQIRWTSGNYIYFLDTQGQLRFTSVGLGLGAATGTTPTPNTVNFTAKMTIRQNEEFTEMFEQAWRALNDSFYDEKHHGLDWVAIRNKYRPIIDHVSMKEDLYSLVSLMLGELNASHLGISGNLRNPDELTADLGLLFDDSYTGPGLKVAEKLRRGPADKRGLNLNVGDIILSIDREEITEKTNLSKLLNGRIGETVTLEVTSNPSDPKSRRKVDIQAVNRSVISDLMYQRWVRNNAETVAKASGGKIGYIHIPSMDENGLEVFVRSLYSDNYDKEAIVIDVRYNGGGFTHDQVLNYLSLKEHTIFKQRGGGEGLVLRSFDRKWIKPSAVLINNRSYSDAEIFPAAFRTMGLGKVIGQSTGGMVIGTGSTQLIDGSSFRLPRIGVYTSKGINMEKEGVHPDVPVDALPEDIAKGIDHQLNKAVEVLTAEVVAWKKARGIDTGAGMGATTTPTPMKTPTPMTMPTPTPAPTPAPVKKD